MISVAANARVQLGHFREREVILSSAHCLQNTCPQERMAVSFHLDLQTEHRAIDWREVNKLTESTQYWGPTLKASS